MDTAAAPAGPPRVVLDTNTWLDLLLFEDPRCAVLREALRAGRARAVIDPPCHAEWRRVLGYPMLRLDAARREALVEAQRHGCEWPDAAVDGSDWPLPRCRDPDDQKFLVLARNAGARYLLSRDRALLVLAPRLRRAGRFTICAPALFDPG